MIEHLLRMGRTAGITLLVLGILGFLGCGGGGNGTSGPLGAAPVITTQPQNQAKVAPDSPTFTVVASGSGLSYQWKKGNAPIAGATSASYTLPGFTDLQTQPDTYSVLVSNAFGTTESNSVTFSVAAPSPYYPLGGEPVAFPSRPLTVLPSLHVDATRFPNGSFRLGYDEALKNPAWTAYADFKVNGAFPNGTGDYQTDTRLAVPQVTPGDMGQHGGAGFYLSSGLGFDRGHMVTRSDVSYRYGSEAGNDATYMSDMIPQVSNFNQRIWNDLEEAVGGTLANGSFSNGLSATFGRVWIYSGPVFTDTVHYWVPSTETYTTTPGTLPAGTKAIAIPTACYRIMVAEPAAGQTLPQVIAWLASNRSYAASESADIWKYVTSVKRVEELTGLDFFPSLPHDSALTSWKGAVNVRGWGPAFEKSAGPNLHIIEPSWDLVPAVGNPVLKGWIVNKGDVLAFSAAVSAGASGSAINPNTGCSWNFGDGSVASTGLSSSHAFSTGGTFTVTFSATDAANVTNTITRSIHVLDPSINTPPTVTPAVLPNITAQVGTPVPHATFTVQDEQTPAGALVVAASSDNAALLPNSGIQVVNLAGEVTMAFSPVAGQTGISTITVTVTDADGASTVKTFTVRIDPGGSLFTEGFEAGTKTGYATGDVIFTSGTWTLNDALVGNLAGSDRFNGTRALRIRNGVVTMKFDWPQGARSVSALHAKFGNDASSTWGLWYSTNGGGTWIQAGNNVSSTTTTLEQVTFTVNITGPIRFEIRKTDGTTSRFNVDDFQISGY